MSQEAELALSPFFISEERAEAVDFTYGVVMDRQALMTPRPKLTGDLTGLIKPFTPQVRVTFYTLDLECSASYGNDIFLLVLGKYSKKSNLTRGNNTFSP